MHHENGRAILRAADEGEEYEFDCTIDAEWYKDWYIDQLLPAVKKMPWLRSKRAVVQQDGASPHTGKNLSLIHI